MAALYLIATGLVVSLTLSVLLTPRVPSAAFYLLPTRSWEMFAGGLAYLFGERFSVRLKIGLALELLGLGSLIAAVCLFDAAIPWPGWHALLPVEGTVLILIAARNQSRWRDAPFVQWLGTRSYSLYLWHWPIVVAIAYLQLTRDALTICAGLAVTLVLGNLSYLLVEMPSRHCLARVSAVTNMGILFGLIATVAIPASIIRHQEGIRGRFSANIERIIDESSNRKPHREQCYSQKGTTSPSCLYGGKTLSAILIGDSHADAVTTALAAALPSQAGGIMDWSYIRCPTLKGVKSMPAQYVAEQKCPEFLEWAVGQLAHIPKHIPLVIVNRTTSYAIGIKNNWNTEPAVPSVYFTEPQQRATPEFLREFAQKITDTACELAKDRPVYLMRPIPEMGIRVPEAMARAMVLGREANISIAVDDYHRRHDFVWAAQDAARDRCDVKILDVLPYLCSGGRCASAKGGRPLYYDQDHLSEFGNKLLIPMFATVFRR